MSCYFRHMKDIFAEVGIEVTAGNKKEIDRAIHRIVGTEYKDCADTWRRVKEEIKADEQKRQEFVGRLKSATG